jgi:hypothetical protein
MVVVYIFTSLVGALITLVALSSYGWLLALLCAPVGGSAFTLIVITVDLVRFHGRLAERAGQRGNRFTAPAGPHRVGDAETTPYQCIRARTVERARSSHRAEPPSEGAALWEKKGSAQARETVTRRSIQIE